MTPCATGPTTERGARTCAALVEAARMVFQRDGFTDSRIVDITREAGCATGSFYTHFSSKEEILGVVLNDAQQETYDPGWTGQVDDDDPLADLDAVHRSYFESYHRHAGLMLLMEQVSGSAPDFRAVRRRRGRAHAQRTGRVIARMQECGQADPGLDPVLTARALTAMVSHLAYYAYVLEEDLDIDELARTTAHLWRNALTRADPDADMHPSIEGER